MALPARKRCYHERAGTTMRDHLATLLYDFRRYDREIAVVRYQGNAAG